MTSTLGWVPIPLKDLGFNLEEIVVRLLLDQGCAYNFHEEGILTASA